MKKGGDFILQKKKHPTDHGHGQQDVVFSNRLLSESRVSIIEAFEKKVKKKFFKNPRLDFPQKGEKNAETKIYQRKMEKWKISIIYTDVR